MTEIVVTGYFAYKGAPPKEVLLHNVDSSLDLPKSGLTLFYGYQSTLAAMSKVRTVADATKMEICTVSITLEVPDDVYAQRLNLKARTIEATQAGVSKRIRVPSLDDAKMIFLDRIGKEAVDVLSATSRKIFAKKDIPYEEGFAVSGRFMTRNPWFLDGLIKDPHLKSAEAIFYWAIEESKPTQYATLFSDASIKSVDTRGVQTIIHFPKSILSGSDKAWKDPKAFA